MDALRARLNVCREQLASNTVFNTPARKKALKTEISEIEAKMSLALGLEDDLDESDSDSTFVKNEDKSSSATTPDSITLESNTPPSSSSSGWTTPAKRMRIKEEEGSYAPPIQKLHLNSYGTMDTKDTKDTKLKSEASGSSFFTVPDDGEKNSVLSALAETGEVFDIDTLLKQQAEMEQRLADLKRRREEDMDESFARSIQEEEFKSSNKTPSSSYTTPSSAPASSSSFDLSTVTKNALQSRLEKARQERMDEEMARLFAESDANTFNLTGSPMKIPDPVHRPTTAPASVYPIFNRQASWSSNLQPGVAPHTPGPPLTAFGTTPFFSAPGTSQHANMASLHANMVANARAFPRPGQAPAPASSATLASSSATPANNLIQSVATSIYGNS